MQNEKSQISDLESAIRSAGKSALNTQSSVLSPQSSPVYPLAEALERLLSALCAASAGGRLRLSGLRGAARAFLLARGLVRAPRPTLCLPPSHLVDHLIQWGYRRVPLVEEKGEMSVRGGIIDVFPPLETQPLRVEFLGDSIESLRAFDPASQRSVEQAGEVTLLPMRFFSLARLQAARRTVEEAMAESEATHREKQRIVENLKSGLPFPGVEFLLPYLYPTLESLSDYLLRGTVVWLVEPAVAEAALDEYWSQLSTHVAQVNTAGH